MKFKLLITDSLTDVKDIKRVLRLKQLADKFGLTMREDRYPAWTAVSIELTNVYVSAESLQELLALIELAGVSVVIGSGDTHEDPWTLEIYNGYRE